MPLNTVNLEGMRFGRLTVLAYAGKSKSRHSRWECVCDCGARMVRDACNLLRGYTVSCGCKRAQAKDPASRILESICVTDSGCWEWQLNRDRAGYGRLKIQLGARDRFRCDAAHRFSYETFVGPIPDGLHVCHSCDNPPCCNPAHLWLGTRSDNMQDMLRKRRASWQKRAAIDAMQAAP